MKRYLLKYIKFILILSVLLFVYSVPIWADNDNVAFSVGSNNITDAGFLAEGRTVINFNNPSIYSGTINSVQICVWSTISGLEFGTFYHVSGNTYKCRDSVEIGDAVGLVEWVTFNNLNLDIEVGDYIGCYYTGGLIVRQITGGDNIGIYIGEAIDSGDEAEYTVAEEDILGLYATGLSEDNDNLATNIAEIVLPLFGAIMIVRYIFRNMDLGNINILVLLVLGMAMIVVGLAFVAAINNIITGL